MSIELPEVKILTDQMDKQLRGKRVQHAVLKDCEKLQRLGFVNKDAHSFDNLVNGKVESVTSRGNVMVVKLDNEMSLVLAPEYGGIIQYYAKVESVPDKAHLTLGFADGSALTVRLTGMGVINALKDAELERSYVYRRDFSKMPSPIDDKGFTFELFSELLADKNVMLKSVLVGKDAVVVGLGNSAFQDIIYRAKLHPKRKASELNKDESRALYNAIKLVVQERLRLGGKDQFTDLYGKEGRYTPAMGPNMKGQTCPSCGASIEKMSLGGGYTFYCPNCQK
jgi:formamidopyrimidine-DNA glycosylase